jgi:SAM-dependent methyltransferase
VLRWGAGDVEGSLALLDAALALDPRHELAAANRAEVARAPRPARWCDGTDAKAAPTALNAWTQDALDLARARAGFEGADVLEVGGAIPPDAARATGARSWTACYLEAQPRTEGAWRLAAADARRLPWEDASFDVVFSSCAFEHVQQLGLALAEIERVLRPGGALVTAFAPIWSYARGHHLWELDGAGRRIMFMDPVVPRFAHLLCDEHELGWYLATTLGPEAGARATGYVYRATCINRLFEGDYGRLFERCGLAPDGLERQRPWAAEDVPSARLAEELRRRHPQGGDFGTPGFRGVLRKPAAPRSARPSRPAAAGRR